MVKEFIFEDVTITLDPFEDKHPIESVKEELSKVNPAAKVILTIRGYINSKKIGMTEASFPKAVEEAANGKCELHFEFKDVESILENDLFKSYLKKLEQRDFPIEKRNQLRDIAVRAMMEQKT